VVESVEMGFIIITGGNNSLLIYGEADTIVTALKPVGRRMLALKA